VEAHPVRNAHARVVSDEPRRVVVEVPRRYPLLLRPIRVLFRLREVRRLEIDGVGLELWRRCDGTTSLAQMIDDLMTVDRLTFHEARLLVLGLLRQLAERGALALVAVQDQKTTPA
jgi:hypothetical protein